MNSFIVTILILLLIPIVMTALGLLVYFKFANKDLPPGPKRAARIFFACWILSMIVFTILIASAILTKKYQPSVITKYEEYQTWHEESLQEIVPRTTTIGDTASSEDFYGMEKVVYTKASYNGLVFGLTKDLVIANIDGSFKDTVLQDIPDTSGLSRFILLPETKEAVLAVPGVTTLQKIDFEKINLETRERVKLGTYEQKFGVELQGAIVSPDQKKLLFTTSGTKIFLMNLDKSGDVPSEPIYTAESGMLIPEIWDEKGNVYLSNFSCFPCSPREPEKNTDGKLVSMLQMNTSSKRLVFFRNIESYAFSADNNYFAWVEHQDDDPNLKVKVYSLKDDAIWFVDSCKVLPETLIWRDATHIQYKVADEYSQYANVVYDVESHIKDMNPIPPSYKIEGRITHDIKIEEGLERGSVKGAKLYINGILIDKIEELSISYGHSSAFEVIGFIHGKSIEQEELKLLYPSYLPENIVLTDADKVKYYHCTRVTCEIDIVGNFGVLKIRQFIDIESLYFPSVLIDDTATFRHLIRKKEDITFDGGKGTYYDLGTLPSEKRLYFDKEDSKMQFFCYGGCTLSKDELVKIAQSMTTEESNIGLDTSNWQTYRNEDFGFGVRYPESWDYREYSAGDPLQLQFYTSSIGNLSRRVYDTTPPDDPSIPQPLKAPISLYVDFGTFDRCHGIPCIEGPRNIIVGGMPAKRMKFPTVETVEVTKGEYTFSLLRETIQRPDTDKSISSENAMAIFDQILSTFRFIDQPISTAKNYCGYPDAQNQKIQSVWDCGDFKVLQLNCCDFPDIILDKNGNKIMDCGGIRGYSEECNKFAHSSKNCSYAECKNN